MTEVLRSPSHFPPSPSSSNTLFHTQTQPFSPNPNSGSSCSSPVVEVVEEVGEGAIDHGLGECDRGERKNSREKEREEISLLALLVAVLRKSLVSCKASTTDELSAMDIGWPTNVRHVAHVTYDRFNGFLGLPVEFEPEVPMRAPSASTSVFGVSTGSMQLSYDTRGNCVPTILLLMQRQLYAQGGLQAEGIFRINAENSQEEIVRDQLNRGLIPDDIEVHILAGLIKAWFRELPTGILDLLSPEQIMQCESEDDCAELVRLLPSSEASLLNWAINLMADVVQEEQFNKMNAHNIAMVFAPNMTQMADPLTALMHAVRVMNFLKTLIMKTLREREDSQIKLGPISCAGPSNDSARQSPSQPPSHLVDNTANGDNCSNNDSEEQYSTYDEDEATLNSSHTSTPFGNESDESSSSTHWDPSPSSSKSEVRIRNASVVHFDGSEAEEDVYRTQPDSAKISSTQTAPAAKDKEAGSNLSLISSRLELIEAWM